MHNPRMPAIAKRKTKRDKLGVYWRDGTAWIQFQGRRFSLGTRDPKAAELAAQQLHRGRADPTYAQARETTLEAACVAWKLARDTAGNRAKPPSAATLEMHDTHLGHLCSILGLELQLAHLDAAAVDRYITTRRHEAVGSKGRKVQATTVDKELGTLRMVLKHAARRGHYPHSIDLVIPEAGDGNPPLTRALTLEQVPLLLAQLSPRRAATCAYIIAFGADWCAVERAERHDLGTKDFCARTALIRGTKNAARWAEVPVVHPFGELADRARKWLVTHGALYAWGKGDRSLDRACKRAGFERVTPRDLRRTHGQILAELGVPPYLIGEMLRHTDSRMAERVYGQRKRETVGRQVAQAMSTGQPRYDQGTISESASR